MTKITPWLIALIVMLGFASLAQAANTGRNPLSWTSEETCEQTWERYKREFDPLVFVVADNGGKCFYSSCFSTCERSSLQQKALQRCRDESGGACQIYAIYGDVVNADVLTLGQ